MTRILTLLFLLLTFGYAEDRRIWKNKSGSKSFEADYVSYADGKVTLLKDGLTEVILDIRKLHKEDKAWIKNRLNNAPVIESIFENLSFGDLRKEVSEKLSKSEIVSTEVEKTFQGRTGLNGIYTTNQKLGGLSFALYFRWEKEKLIEITLRSENRNAEGYDTDLQSAWGEAQELMTQLYGEPSSKVAFPNITEVDSRGEGILGTHLWKPRRGLDILLGPALEREEYFIVVRICPEI